MAPANQAPSTLWHAAVLEPRSPRFPGQAGQVIEEIDRLRQSTRGLTRQILDTEGRAVNWLLEGLYQAFFSLPRSAIAIPLSPRFYTGSRFGSVRFPLGVVSRTLEAVESLGWVQIHKGAPALDGGLVTTVEAAGTLASVFSEAHYEWAQLELPPDESQLLLAEGTDSKRRRFVRANEAPQVAKWQQNLRRINDLNLSRCIYLDAPNDLILDAGMRRPLAAQQSREVSVGALCFSQVTLRRIFARGRLDHGGRFYGGWWQRVPSEYRRYIGIDDSLTCEADYSGMALNCLYASEGKDPGSEDPYDIGLHYEGSDDPRRKIVKRYLNAILNDEKGSYLLPHDEQSALGLGRRELRDRIERRHAAIAQHFHTGVGLKLQFMESQVAEQVMLRFADQGDVCLPIHDSFIVRHELIDQLVQVMKEEFRSAFGRGISVKPEEVLLGERIAIPDPAHIPHGLTPSEQDNALHAIHWGRVSIANSYHTSWVMAQKTQAEINADYLRAIETWEWIRPRIQEITRDVRFP